MRKRTAVILILLACTLLVSACRQRTQSVSVPESPAEESASITVSEAEDTEQIDVVMSFEAFSEKPADPPSNLAPTESTPLFETPSAPPVQTIYVPDETLTKSPTTARASSAETNAPRQTEPTFPPGPYTGGSPASAPSKLPKLDLRADPTGGGYPAFIQFNGGKPLFTTAEVIACEDLVRAYSDEIFEFYSPLDELGRCGYAFAIVGKETMPSAPRGSIVGIRPSGWHTVRYDDLIYDRYLYNRCHLIAYELTGENANERNLITGTRYMNISGMLDFEDKTAAYIRWSGNHVLYRATPVFHGSDPVAYGVLLEAYSLEDRGTGLSFCVFCPNVQPGIVIDYATGDSWRAEN